MSDAVHSDLDPNYQSHHISQWEIYLYSLKAIFGMSVYLTNNSNLINKRHSPILVCRVNERREQEESCSISLCSFIDERFNGVLSHHLF